MPYALVGWESSVDPITRTLVRSIYQHCVLQYKNKYDKRVEPDLFRLVKVLGFGSSLVGGRAF